MCHASTIALSMAPNAEHNTNWLLKGFSADTCIIRLSTEIVDTDPQEMCLSRCLAQFGIVVIRIPL